MPHKFADAEHCDMFVECLRSPSRRATPAGDLKHDFEELYQVYGKYTKARYVDDFYKEIYPLLLITMHVGGDFTLVKFHPRTSRFDGSIFLASGHEQKVEMTAAIDGHQDALRKEHTDVHGHSPALGRINVRGPKHRRKYGRNQIVAMSMKEIVRDDLMPLVSRTIKNKLEKSKKNPHYHGAWLGIVFDDYVFSKDKERREYLDPLFLELSRKYSKIDIPFAKLFFIGRNGNYIS